MEISFDDKKCTIKCTGEENINLLKELYRRVNITYRCRINATNRLRNKHKEYKKLNIYYSALVTAVSIISIGVDSKIKNIPISNIVLMFSIVLSYFMFYISEQNLQERAYRMEETFKALDKLKNKISIMLEYRDEIHENDCKKLYKEYESILESIENHEQIDYDLYKFQELKNKKELENNKLYIEIERRIRIYKFNKLTLKSLKYLIPTLIILSSIILATLK